ncbi:P-loop containing nucleoside triphosphate hydrolase protein [Aspergillus crustosus]
MPCFLAPDTFEPLVIHRTTCSLRNNHFDHPAQADYFDAPRLFCGDSRASNLRGERYIPNTEDYLREHNKASFVWIKIYCCDTYLESLDEHFEDLREPKHPMNDTIKRHFSILPWDGDEAVPASEEIVITSRSLQDEVADIIKIHTDRISRTNSSTQSKQAVYRLYVHLRQSLPATNHPTSDLAHLLRYVETAFGHNYDEADDMLSRGYVSKDQLEKLFWPNEIVVTRRDWSYLHGNSLVLPCIHWSFDGRFFQEHELVELDWTFGDEAEVPITGLTVYPLRFDEICRRRLLERGAEFWKCREKRFVSYLPSPIVAEARTTKPRYMLDAQTYHHLHTKTLDTAERIYLAEEKHNADSPSDADFQVLLPPTIQGFGFHDKKWISIPVDEIDKIEWDDKAFEHIVLKDTKKELIQALVAKHTAANNAPSGIKGESNSLILLLHGSPGTGKTLTAESVAELTCKPLYRVTCGDIGTDAEEVERYIKSVLYLGTIWECVVLLEEADVFLGERTKQDLQRSALVSVFLRALEEYPGTCILILTTNTVRRFNESLMSRVQLTLYYPPLDENSRRQIWSNFITTRLTRTNPKAISDQLLDNLDELATFQLQGREIRNSFRMALLLADFRHEPLQYSHLRDVIDVSGEFREYLIDTHGHRDSE